MGLFYAHLYDNRNYEYLLTFASCETANEWWRMISAPPSPYAGKITRISPQFFIYSNAHITSFWYFSSPALPDSIRLQQNMNIKQVSDTVTIPSITVADHISGRWYFIRSKSDPWSHWYVRIKGVCLVCGNEYCDAVHVSSEYRTKFCIRAHDATDGEFIMIGRDGISIAAPKGCVLHIVDEENLKATQGHQGETDLRFGDLKDRFITQAEKQVNGEVWESVVAVEKGAGEAWELID